MDSLTHTVLGACMGEAIAGKQMGKKAMLVGALAHNFPDADVLFNFFTTQANALLTHRGITHSIFFNCIFSIFLAWLFLKYTKNKAMIFNRWLLLISSGLFTHIILDAFTAYGTGWFEPFNHHRVSFNTLFILDPLLLIPLLIGALVLIILKRNSTRRSRIAYAVLTISGVYLCICIFNKLYVKHHVEKDLTNQNIIYDEYMTTPTPLNNLLYNVIVRKQNDFYIGYYSVFDKTSSVHYKKINRNDSLLLTYKNDDEIKKLIRFSKGYYTVTHENSHLVFSDLRFGQLGGWYQPEAPFVFRFNIEKTSNNRIALQQGRFHSVKPDILNKLLERIKGINN